VQTPKEFIEAVSAAHAGIGEPPIVTVLAELEHAAVIAPSRVAIVFGTCLPLVVACSLSTLVIGAAVGVAIGKQFR
jgi:hypothetical protein